MRRKRSNRGRAKMLQDSDVDKIMNRIQRDYKEKIWPIKDLAIEEGIQTSEWMVQRALKHRGYSKRVAYWSPHIRPAQAAQRL